MLLAAKADKAQPGLADKALPERRALAAVRARPERAVKGLQAQELKVPQAVKARRVRALRERSGLEAKVRLEVREQVAVKALQAQVPKERSAVKEVLAVRVGRVPQGQERRAQPVQRKGPQAAKVGLVPRVQRARERKGPLEVKAGREAKAGKALRVQERKGVPEPKVRLGQVPRVPPEGKALLVPEPKGPQEHKAEQAGKGRPEGRELQVPKAVRLSPQRTRLLQSQSRQARPTAAT